MSITFFSIKKIFGKEFGRCVVAFFKGCQEEIVGGVYTDNEVTKAEDVVQLLRDCEPWEKHVKGEAIKKFGRLVRDKKGEAARKLIEKSLTEEHLEHCVKILCLAATMCIEGAPSIICRSLPGYWVD